MVSWIGVEVADDEFAQDVADRCAFFNGAEFEDFGVVQHDLDGRAVAAGFVYVVAGVRPIDADQDLTRLAALLLPGQRYLHWRDEPNARRREIVAVLNEIALDIAVAVAVDVRPRRQEHARAICLAHVVSEALAAALPVTAVAIESRGAQLDERDRYTIRDELRRLDRHAAPTIEFVTKTASPLLWIADAVTSMASAHFSEAPGSDYWWRSLRPNRLIIRRADH